MTDALAGKAVDPKAVLTGSAPIADSSEGMSYLHNVPRRLVTLYLPLTIILLVLLFLGLAFRQLYFVPQSCDSEANCSADRTRNTQRIIFWIVASLVLCLVAIPWLLPLYYR